MIEYIGGNAGFSSYYNWQPIRGLRLMAGGSVDIYGAIKNQTRNVNNPSSGDIQVNLMASVGAQYKLSWKRWALSFDYMASTPLIGGMFVPELGQSYYEIFSLGHYDNNVVVTHPFNAPTARMLFTLEIPFKKSALLVGYWGEARQSKLHHLKRHTWTNGLMIGYAATFLRCSR
jgi:hypothetical protein